MNDYTSRMIICEGLDDKCFFEKLIEARQLPKYIVSDTSSENHHTGGITKFRMALNEKKNKPKQYNLLDTIIVAADNDDDPDGNFNLVAGQVQDFIGARPQRPLEFTKKRPRVAIVMIPWIDEPGTLETLIIPPIKRQYAQLSGNVDYFVDLEGKHWDGRKRHNKAWVRVATAVLSPDPFDPLGRIIKNQRNLIDFSCPSLQGLADFLTSSASL
ncbi:MAG: hypothetical protein IOC63_19675 [Methylobacterium sp.]|nr:hypothetical protein [Methylobacterium sp.]